MQAKLRAKIAQKTSDRNNKQRSTRKRCIKRNKNIKNQVLKLYGINAAGIKSKTESFNNVLTKLRPHIWMIQETKLKPNEQINCEALNNYQVFYLYRHESQGGGIALGVTKKLESTFVTNGNDDTEVMVALVTVGKISIRVIVGYGVQENASKEKKDAYWDFIEKEIVEAENENQGVIVQMDGNLHAGNYLVKNDPNPQNKNGKIFMQFLQRNKTLSIVNGLDICQGVITRQRILKSRTEKAVLDFFLVNERLRPFLKSMIIDEKREFTLSNFAQAKKNKRIIETDHNGLILEIGITFSDIKPERKELFNMKNKVCQDAFKIETENNKELLKCFDSEFPLEVQSKHWLKIFNTILHKCFRKNRICERKKKNITGELIEERLKLKNEVKENKIDEEMKNKIELRISQIEETIGNKVVEDFHKEIKEAIDSLGGDETSLNGSGRQQIWKLLKKKFPKAQAQFPVGKKDQKGHLITNHLGLKQLYLKTYLNRLRNRPIKQDYDELKQLKGILFEMRLKMCKEQKSEPWEMKHLEAAMNKLKVNKSRDPNGWLNDIFKEGVAGKNLKISMLKLFNRMKMENYFPDFMRKADISTIYKGKGEKSELRNDRGIFIVSVFRSLLMKLIYQDIYEIIDKSMSDSQIGSRKDRNIRNHIWVVNSVICDTISTKKKSPVDIQIYDYKEAFDSLWLEECLNDMFEGGLKDDKFNLIHNANSLVDIVVRTPVGKTNSGSINNFVLQGDVLAPILCSKQIDTIGKECLEDKKYLYLYKKTVEIPPLTMVDDVLCISECGFKTAMVNAFIQSKTASKKLQFGGQKCKKIHIGKDREEYKCQQLYVDSWSEVERVDTLEIEDKYNGEELMEEIDEAKYLGDLISKDGRNIRNIKLRVNKGKGIVQKIIHILEGIPFGKLYFEVAMILRNTLLVSSVLCNSETWFNLTKAELDLLETVDVMLLRSILGAPISTPKEMLYLELGVIPYRDIIRGRRLTFLHYILNQDPNSVIFKVLEAQIDNQTSKDWVTTVLEDLKALELEATFADIRGIKKMKWKNIVKNIIKEKALEQLNLRKQKHSKVNKLKHNKLEMQSYFLGNELNITKDEIRLIFQIRSRVIKIKSNMKGSFENYECEVCLKENESQEHIYNCIEIWKIRNENRSFYNYNNIYTGDTKQKLEIARVFRQNMKIYDEMWKK